MGRMTCAQHACPDGGEEGNSSDWGSGSGSGSARSGNFPVELSCAPPRTRLCVSLYRLEESWKV